MAAPAATKKATPARRKPADHKAKNGAAFDLDTAIRGARTEAEADPFIFTFRKGTFSVPAPTDWPITVTALLAENNLAGAMADLLGDQWDEFAKRRPSVGDVEVLFREVASWAGVTLPN